jgi:hypothetical protein
VEKVAKMCNKGTRILLHRPSSGDQNLWYYIFLVGIGDWRYHAEGHLQWYLNKVSCQSQSNRTRHPLGASGEFHYEEEGFPTTLSSL